MMPPKAFVPHHNPGTKADSMLLSSYLKVPDGLGHSSLLHFLEPTQHCINGGEELS